MRMATKMKMKMRGATMTNDLRERLAASVGGRERLAGNFSARTFGDLHKRAEREIESAAALIEETLERIAKALAAEKLEAFAAPTDELVTKLIAKWAAYQHAGSRVANWMITGPARFPVASNNKRMDTEHKRLGEYLDFAKQAPSRAVQNAKRAQKQAIGPAGVVDAELQDLRARLESREQRQRMMKATNEMIRRHKLGEGDGAQLASLMEERGFKLDPSLCHRIMRPAWQGARVGFESFSLSNNNAEIKRLRDRVAQVEAKAARVEADAPAAERIVNGVTVIEDPVDDRLRLVFDGKPEPQIITLLKSRGFRWSPRNTAWQRQLTNNARYAAEGVLKQIGEAA
jgi:hypothetical protein